MKRGLSIFAAFLILIGLASAKTGFEYGGTTLFLENQQYQDGYDKMVVS